MEERVCNPNEGEHIWTIPHFSTLHTLQKVHSEEFVVGGLPWDILLFPRGNDEVRGQFLSVFLNVADAHLLLPGWTRRAHLWLTVVNHAHPERSVSKGAVHEFTINGVDWGCNTLVPLTTVLDHSKGFLRDDRLEIRARVMVEKAASKFRSSKRQRAAGPIEAQGPDEGEHTWVIPQLSLLPQLPEKMRSEDFMVGGLPWDILLFPRGNEEVRGKALSVYLNATGTDQAPPGWSRKARFKLTVINQDDLALSVSKEAVHEFTARAVDWGYTTMMPLKDVLDPKKGFIKDDSLEVRAHVTVFSPESKGGLLWRVD